MLSLPVLHRILGMPVDLQNRLFKYFTDTLAAIVTQAKKTGKYDMGILGGWWVVERWAFLFDRGVVGILGGWGGEF